MNSENIYAEPLFLNPVLTHNIWGGTRLRDDYGYQVEGNDIGESVLVYGDRFLVGFGPFVTQSVESASVLSRSAVILSMS